MAAGHEKQTHHTEIPNKSWKLAGQHSTITGSVTETEKVGGKKNRTSSSSFLLKKSGRLSLEIFVWNIISPSRFFFFFFCLGGGRFYSFSSLSCCADSHRRVRVMISHFTDASNGRWLEFYWSLKVGGSLWPTHMAENLLDYQPTLLRSAAEGGSVYWSLGDKRPRCHSLHFTATSRLITSSPLLNHFSGILVSVFGWHGNSDHTGLRKKGCDGNKEI